MRAIQNSRKAFLSCKLFTHCQKVPFRGNVTLGQCFSTRSPPSEWRDLLEPVASGKLSPEDAMRHTGQTQTNAEVLESFANLDHNRQKRAGFPEAVFAEGKTPLQVAAILDDMAKHADPESSSSILATRVSPEMYEELETSFSFTHGAVVYHEMARIIAMQSHNMTTMTPESAKAHRIVVATAGTTDLPVAEEAAVTLEATGKVTVDRIYDVGVAGLHRILRALPRLNEAECVIVVAGMDGALPSVVGGLVKVPVIAVPTSIGYGASFGGVSALLTMLNSCSPGVGVVNIDNGFGGAALAYKSVVGKHH